MFGKTNCFSKSKKTFWVISGNGRSGSAPLVEATGRSGSAPLVEATGRRREPTAIDVARLNRVLLLVSLLLLLLWLREKVGKTQERSSSSCIEKISNEKGRG